MSAAPRVLVLGGTGMLGHRLWLACRERLDTYVTVRADAAPPAGGLLDADRTVVGVRAEDPASVARALDAVSPSVVVNAIAVVKQAAAGDDPATAFAVNALLPHGLARACAGRGARLVQLSTDCVFSGDRGGYREDDRPDPPDVYGRSKLLGELVRPGCLTIRTSFIGRELGSELGLLEWFLAQRGGSVRGFRRAFFSGLTSGALAALIAELIERHPDLDGLWHVGGERIDKHALLVMLRDRLALDVEIVADDAVAIDRSLDSRRFRARTGFAPPTWEQLVDGLASDPTPYDEMRSANAVR